MDEVHDKNQERAKVAIRVIFSKVIGDGRNFVRLVASVVSPLNGSFFPPMNLKHSSSTGLVL